MANKQDSNQEPSIEEILDSIRQIISDDDEGTPTAEAPAPAPTPVQDEPIELTERVQDKTIEVDMKESEAEPVAAAPAPKPEPKPEPVKAASPPAPKEPIYMADASSEELNTILTKNAEDSVMGAFTELTKRASVEHGDGVTVEDIVREELKPLIKQWLDKHLPSMVERLLQNEMERISKRVLGDE